MQRRIEPPVLLSRLLMFVFAGTVVVLFVLFMTLGKMFPLNRPQVFFLTSKPATGATVQVSEMPPSMANFDMYMSAFVMEYIRLRNDVERNTGTMRVKWGNGPGGVVAAWSDAMIYAKFQQTGMYKAIMTDYPDFEFTCNVDFVGAPIMLSQNVYRTNIRYSCASADGQTDKKDYTIIVGLRVIDNASVPWIERLNNPLGLKVEKYEIDGGAGDPLDTGYTQ